MARLLHISSSPRAERSESLALAEVFLASYREANPDDTIDTLDLWSHTLPPLDSHSLDAKYAILRKLQHTPQQAAAWAAIESEAERLRSYDKLLFSAPMWNWSIPFILKNYIDVVTQPGLLFDWTPEHGYVGRLGRPAAVIYASSFDYGPGAPMAGFDYQKSYLAHWLRIVGCTKIVELNVAPTASAPAVLRTIREAASDKARTEGKRF